MKEFDGTITLNSEQDFYLKELAELTGQIWEKLSSEIGKNPRITRASLETEAAIEANQIGLQKRVADGIAIRIYREWKRNGITPGQLSTPTLFLGNKRLTVKRGENGPEISFLRVRVPLELDRSIVLEELGLDATSPNHTDHIAISRIDDRSWKVEGILSGKRTSVPVTVERPVSYEKDTAATLGATELRCAPGLVPVSFRIGRREDLIKLCRGWISAWPDNPTARYVGAY